MKAKRLLINLAVFLLSGFVIAYIIIQLLSGLTTDVSYEYALAKTTENTIEKTGYLVRNEKVLYTNHNGVVAYFASESQKIGANQLVATVFSTAQGVDIQNQIQKIDQEVAILERSSVDTNYLTSDISKIDSKIHDALVKLRLAMTEDNISLTSQYKDELLICMNKRQLIVSGQENFQDRIQALQQKKAELTNSLQDLLHSVYATSPGYFSTLLDGYESVFTPEKVKNLTVDSFHRLISENRQDYGELAIGKIVTDFHWHTLCEVSAAEAEELIVGASYPVTFLYSSGQQLNAILEKKVTQTDKDSVVLCFLIEEIPQDFDYTRQQPIRIVKEKVEGIAFPRSALRILNGVQGVYVISGNTVAFRKVNIIYSADSYYYSLEQTPGNEDAGSFLSRYDRVITEGKDLYVGKILN